MRVALIGPVPPDLGGMTPGGVATHQAHLAAGLAASGQVEVSLLATNARACGPAPRLTRASESGYCLERLFMPAAPTGFVAPNYLRRVGTVRLLRYAAALAGQPAYGSRREDLAQTLWYEQYLARTRPDVVHVQHPLERARYVRLLERLEARRRPLVITAHSFFGEHPDHVIRDLMAPNLRAADRVIAVSRHIADQAVELGVAAGRVRVIRSGVDTRQFAPRERGPARERLNIKPEVPLVLFAGNLEPRKQVDVLLRAMALVCEGRADVRLVIVGSGESAGADDQTARLQALTAELGLSASVAFAGRVPSPTLLDWYAAADVFALPSSSEAQGIAALEAMASGLPVVASAVGGLLETIEDDHTGCLVPAGVVAPLAHALTALLADEPARRRIGQAARARVARDFTWAGAVEKTLAVYRELVP